MQPIEFQPSYRRENGLWSLDVDEIPTPDGFVVVDQWIVSFSPGTRGGDHRHPRSEGFVALTPGLRLLVEGVDGVEQFDMCGGSGLRLWMMPSMLAHAVVNVSDQVACMYEVADGEQVDVERVFLGDVLPGLS